MCVGDGDEKERRRSGPLDATYKYPGRHAIRSAAALLVRLVNPLSPCVKTIYIDCAYHLACAQWLCRVCPLGTSGVCQWLPTGSLLSLCSHLSKCAESLSQTLSGRFLAFSLFSQHDQ